MDHNNHYPVIGFLGAGNMASAIIHGMIASGWPSQSIIACRRNVGALAPLTRAGVHTTTDVEQLVTDSNTLVLGVKPWQIEETCQLIQPMLPADTTIVSLAAGIPLQTMQAVLPKHWIIRTMPNTPVASRRGVTAIYSNQRDHQKTQRCISLFQRLGMAFHLNKESDIHAVTALSGSGPAYYFNIMALMQQVALQLGMEESTARELVLATLAGTASLAKDSDESFATLRDRIVSKGGTTEAALQVFDNNNLVTTITDAVTAARDKSKELAGE